MVEIIPKTAGLRDYNGMTAVRVLSLLREEARLLNLSECLCMLAFKIAP